MRKIVIVSDILAEIFVQINFSRTCARKHKGILCEYTT